jgi:hypothetical protein
MKLVQLLREIKKEEYVIYSDMDGVITDFDERFMKYSKGIPPSQYESENGKEAFWDLITKEGVKFWVGMDWMPDGETYWKYIKKYNPILLSAPSREESSKLGKRLWVKKNLPGTKLMLAYAKDKQKEAAPNHILIDDRKSNIDEWRANGGIGILHTSAASTIKQLQDLGL